MDDSSQRVRHWSNLPPDILFLFLKYLNNTETDRRRLRSVCTSWRSSISPLKSRLQFPLQIKPTFPDHVRTYPKIGLNDTGILRQSIFYLISSPHKNTVCLTRVEETSDPLIIRSLLNPITPPDDFCQPKVQLRAYVNFLDYRASEVTRSYSLHHRLNQNLMTKKTVMLPKSASNDGHFSLLALWNNQNLGLFKSGAKKWVTIPKGCHGFGDIIAYEGMFYATDIGGKLICIDPITFEVKEIIKSHLDVFEKQKWLFAYLVESNGRLYLVNKSTDVVYGKPYWFKVFILGYSCSPTGEINHIWETVTNLGNRVFFVTEYVTFSVLAHEFGWDRGNSLFFTQEGEFGHENYYLYEGSEDELSCHFIPFSRYTGLYTLGDGKIITDRMLRRQYTKIFWPVPSWLIPHYATDGKGKTCEFFLFLFAWLLFHLVSLIYQI